MTIPRMLGLLVALAAVGTAVVVIRVDESRVSHRIQKLQFRETDLRREIWTQELRLAQLRSPGLVRERATRLKIDTAGGDVKSGVSGVRKPR